MKSWSRSLVLPSSSLGKSRLSIPSPFNSVILFASFLFTLFLARELPENHLRVILFTVFSPRSMISCTSSMSSSIFSSCLVCLSSSRAVSIPVSRASVVTFNILSVLCVLSVAVLRAISVSTLISPMSDCTSLCTSCAVLSSLSGSSSIPRSCLLRLFSATLSVLGISPSAVPDYLRHSLSRFSLQASPLHKPHSLLQFTFTLSRLSS
mmetsp:Transcript_11139/g.34131  ORF Transcript_11139/g.34131 Transcript_11139/m.34131 type:complete len:208 (-) Transcript_11139:33-656(-)